MTSPPADVTVCCPSCASLYVDWFRPSINLDLDDFDDEYVDAASSAVCPNCGHKIYFDTLVVINDVFYAPDVGESDAPASGA
jgi:hypothetical protein